MSSNVILQQQVLSLLAQLIKLRVNYSLLDADQVSRMQQQLQQQKQSQQQRYCLF